jgi:hypothetical protein
MTNTEYDLDEARGVAEIIIKINEYCSNYTVEQLVGHMIHIANTNYPEYSNTYGYVATMGFVVTVCKSFLGEQRYIKFSVDGFLIKDYINKYRNVNLDTV